MKAISCRIDFGNGWSIFISEVDGAPFITANFENKEIVAGNSLNVKFKDNSVVFEQWD